MSHFQNDVDVKDHDEATKGLQLAGVLVTASAAEINKLDGVTATTPELNFLAGVTAGTVTASKAVVVGANKNVDTLVIADGGLKLGSGAGTAVGSTAAELNSRTDDSVMFDARVGAGAISVDKAYTAISTTDSDQAMTLAAPTKPAFLKVIKMEEDLGDAILDSTNILGQSTGSTSITFSGVGQYLVLVSDIAGGKWLVVQEGGVSAS